MTIDTIDGNSPTRLKSSGEWMPLGRLLSISAYWLAFNLHWMALLIVIIPHQVQEIAPHNKALIESFIIGSGAIVGLVVPLLVGALSDRCTSRWGRRRPYMAAGAAVNLLGLFILWTAGSLRSLWLYAAGYLVIQLGSNMSAGAYNGVIPDLVPKPQWGEASGYMAVMTQTGNIVGAFGSGLLMHFHQVAASFLLIALTLVLFLAITLKGMREAPLDRTPEPFQWGRFLRSLWIDPRQHPDFAWVWITRALVTMGLWTVQPWIQFYLADVIHRKDAQAMSGYLLGTLTITATITGLVGGKLSDRIGRKRVVYAANTFIALMAIAFCFGHSLLYVYIVGSIYGLGYGAYYSVDWALGCDVLPNKAEAAKDMGIWHVSMVLPQAIAPLISAGMLTLFGQTTTIDPTTLEKVSHYTLPGYQAIFCLAAFYLLLGAFFLRNVKGTT